MANNRNTGRNNAAFVLIVSLLIIVFVIVSYFMLSKEFVKGGSSTGVYVPEKTSNVRNMLNTGEKEVFHIRDNVFTYDQAKAICAAHGSRLATIEEMIDAYRKGANWCSYGWSDGQLALYPTQKDFWAKLQSDPYKKNECGKPGVNGGYFENKAYHFGANCFGLKPGPKQDEKEKQKRIGKSRLSAMERQIDEYQKTKGEYTVAPFNEDNWSR